MRPSLRTGLQQPRPPIRPTSHRYAIRPSAAPRFFVPLAVVPLSSGWISSNNYAQANTDEGAAGRTDRPCIGYPDTVRCRSCHATLPWGATAVSFLSHVVSDTAAEACAQAPASAPAVRWRERCSIPCARTCPRLPPAQRRVRPPHSAVRDAPPHSRARWHRWRWFHHPPNQSGQHPAPR